MAQNCYGDTLTPNPAGYGVDIASQRADDLDQIALDFLSKVHISAKALDLACGGGGQAVRMARVDSNIKVLASDIVDLKAGVEAHARAAGVVVTFIRQDMRALPGNLLQFAPFDVVVCQRAIHYLRYDDAGTMLRLLKELLHPLSRLYLSASGLHSELGQDYPGKDVPIPQRYHPLAAPMAEKHSSHGPVCLYTVEEIDTLLVNSGYRVLKAFRSTFGNVKSESCPT
jgi:SAM-dependent methyltransferase